MNQQLPKVRNDLDSAEDKLNHYRKQNDSVDLSSLDRSSIITDGLLQPLHGFVYVDQQVSLLIYVPDPGFIGADTFQYLVCDQGPDTFLCDSAFIYVTVHPPVNSKSHQALNKLGFFQSDTLKQSLPGFTEHQIEKAVKYHISKNRLSPGIYRYIPDISDSRLQPVPQK